MTVSHNLSDRHSPVTWYGTRRDSRAPDTDMGRSEVIEESGRVVVVARRHDDIYNAAGAVEGFLEGRLARVLSHHLGNRARQGIHNRWLLKPIAVNFLLVKRNVTSCHISVTRPFPSNRK